MADKKHVLTFHSDAVEDGSVHILELTGIEEISRYYVFTLDLVSKKADIDFKEMLKKPARIEIKHGVKLAGGDKRGQQSAALRVQADEDRAELDLRVDDHEQPLHELQRLYRVSLQRFQPFVACLAGRHDPVGETDRARIEARIQQFTAALPREPDQAPLEPTR